MLENRLVGLASILLVAVAARWFAWSMRLPAIVVLLGAGLLFGPLTGLLDPERLLGGLLAPIVSLSVGVILFEGGMSLRISELRNIGAPVVRLVTIGIAVTFALTTVAARWVLDLPLRTSMLVGAILVVTGPTVIGPLLQRLRPKREIGAVLKWEGIFNDAIGAVFAVLVFEAVVLPDPVAGPWPVLLGLTRTVGVSVGLAAAFGILLLIVLLRDWVPEFLHGSVTLAFVIGAFVLSDELQTESGLLTVTLMGMLLANQRRVPVRHISEFKQNLSVLLVSVLFVLLAARIAPATLRTLSWSMVAFVALLVAIIRPVAVALSTVRTKLDRRARLFIACIAPRGVVAAAVASVFGFWLQDHGFPAGDRLVPIVFTTILLTALFYGLLGAPLGRRLSITEAHASGVLILGAQAWAREIAQVLRDHGISVVLVDSNRANVIASRMQGLYARYGSAMGEDVLDELEVSEVGRLLALTPNDEANALASLHFSEVFGRASVYQLPAHRKPTAGDAEPLPPRLQGRPLFSPEATFANLDNRFHRGAKLHARRVPEDLGMRELLEEHGENPLPLFVIRTDGTLDVLTADRPVSAGAGDVVVLLSGDEGSPRELASRTDRPGARAAAPADSDVGGPRPAVST